MRGDFSYSQVQDGAGLQLGVTIIADGDAVREKMREDAATAGFRVLDCCELDEFASGIGPLGDLILVDCHAVDAQTLAMLSRLDMRAGKSGAQVIVSTSLDTLDAVFGCLSMSGAEILVS
ncbi:MAG: MarR family transcriptional regulator, partial [Citromicrobium sp.]